MRATTLKPAPMRKPQRLQHAVQTVPAPVGGLDSVNPLAAMPAQNAVELDNFISSDYGLAVREGWYEYANGIDGGAPVRTLMSYDGGPPDATTNPLSTSELFAVTDSGIWFIEGGGAIAAGTKMIALSGIANAGKMSWTQFSTSGNAYLIACSEIDGGYLYDGAAWMKMVSGGAGPGHVNGKDPSAFVHVCAWKHRLIFTERASASAWVLSSDSIGGTLTEFDFGPLLTHGGVLLAVVPWTMDAGAGIDDRLVLLGSNGDISVYEGNDPTTLGSNGIPDFHLVGTWYVGEMPVGRRNFTDSGGNVYVLSQYGLVPISQIVQGGLDNVLTSDTEMLKQLRLMQETFRKDFASKIHVDGWEVLDVPAKVLMCILRPKVSSTDHVMYGFQLHNLAWCRLIDIPCITMYQRLNEVYAGCSDGRVLRVLDGYSDGKKFDGTGSYTVRAKVTPAFGYFGDPSTFKQALMVRPTFLAVGSMAWTVEMNVDFIITRPTIAIGSPAGSDSSLWDSARWDQARWTPDTGLVTEWRMVEGLGRALTPTLNVSTQVRTVLASISHIVKPGGPL